MVEALASDDDVGRHSKLPKSRALLEPASERASSAHTKSSSRLTFPTPDDASLPSYTIIHYHTPTPPR